MLSSGLHITSFTREECVYVSSIYDTNLNDSVYTLSLTVSEATVSTVIISDQRANLTVYTFDLHGMFYCFNKKWVPIIQRTQMVIQY